MTDRLKIRSAARTPGRLAIRFRAHHLDEILLHPALPVSLRSLGTTTARAPMDWPPKRDGAGR